MATKKTKRRAPASKKSGTAFPAMSDLMKAIEENFRALAAMVPTGSSPKAKRKAPKRKSAPKRKPATKRSAASRAKTAIKRAAAKTRRAMPKAKKRSRRGDKRPSASAPV